MILVVDRCSFIYVLTQTVLVDKLLWSCLKLSQCSVLNRFAVPKVCFTESLDRWDWPALLSRQSRDFSIAVVLSYRSANYIPYFLRYLIQNVKLVFKIFLKYILSFMPLYQAIMAVNFFWVTSSPTVNWIGSHLHCLPN